MGLIKGIHHVEFMTRSLDQTCQYLIKAFGFHQIFSSGNERILKSGEAIFIAKEIPHNRKLEIESVYDIAIEVNNINELIDRAIKMKVPIIKPIEKISDKFGHVFMAQIKSCIGNVVHTILNKNDYQGNFLPGYEIEYIKSINHSQLIKNFDHIAFATKRNTSNDIIKWYSDVFDMKRFLVNNQDLIDEGFVLDHKSSGMRLKAFEYWKCTEICVSNVTNTCKFVIGEELIENANNQIGVFLRNHGCPGIQHIGFTVNDIVATSKIFKSNGAQFYMTPSEYYELIYQNPKVLQLNIPMESLKEYGILLDTEADRNDSEQSAKDECFLFQVFTKPIFEKDTFFLELIERRGATGFGAGNIKALWDALEELNVKC